MYKKLLVVSAFCLGMMPVFAQSTQSTINKCSDGKGGVIYTEFDCPNDYDPIADTWLSETNMTTAEQFGDMERAAEPKRTKHSNEPSTDELK